jgi:hypothetical protein
MMDYQIVFFKGNAGELKAKIIDKDNKAFEKILRQFKPRMRRAFRLFFESQRDEVKMMIVSESLRTGTLPVEFMETIEKETSSFVSGNFKAILAAAFFTSGGGMSERIGSAIGTELFFNPNTIDALKFIEKKGADLVVQMTRSQMDSLKVMLDHAIKNNWKPGEATRFMKSAISLTRRETAAVVNVYKKTVDENLKRFLDQGLSVSEATRKAKNVGKFRAQRKASFLYDTRANRIAVTELKRAHVEAQISAHRQAIKSGVISKAKKTWRKGNIKDNWGSSNLYNSKTIPIDEDFRQFGIPAKTTMLDFMGPGEINERCYLEFNVYK